MNPSTATDELFYLGLLLNVWESLPSLTFQLDGAAELSSWSGLQLSCAPTPARAVEGAAVSRRSRPPLGLARGRRRPARGKIDGAVVDFIVVV